MRRTVFMLLACLMTCGQIAIPVAYAQQIHCGGGAMEYGGGNAGYTVCVPMDTAATPVIGSVNPGPAWATRWGAIAIDGAAGRFGGAEGLNSERQAKKAAIKECQRNGGKKCKVIGQHRNQCGALASGPNYTVSWGGPDIEKTIEDAVSACNDKVGNCQAYYAGCSYPERVR